MSKFHIYFLLGNILNIKLYERVSLPFTSILGDTAYPMQVCSSTNPSKRHRRRIQDLIVETKTVDVLCTTVISLTN